MKRAILNMAICIAILQTIPSHAMLVRTARRTALQTNLFGANTNAPQVALSTIDMPRLQPNSRLLVQRLASQQNPDPFGNTEDRHEESSRDSHGERQDWKERFRSRFARSEAAPALGFSLFGVHLWWSDDEICQTPEDFEDPEKLAQTNECFLSGGKDRIFNVFMRNFDTLKDNPVALDKILEFLYTTFDDLKVDKTKMLTLIHPILNARPLIEKNSWGKKLMAKIANETITIENFFLNASTQSAQHFKAIREANYEKIFFFSKPDGSLATCLPKIIQTVLDIEKTEQEQGNYTFIHTYHWDIHFFQDIDAHLRSIVYGTPLQPLSLRFIKAPGKSADSKYESVRKDIVTTGASLYYADEDNKQKHMLFMNFALFAGCSSLKYWIHPYLSNALHFFVNNQSERKPRLKFSKIARHLNTETYFKRYSEEFAELKALHNTASEYGAGIILSFTPEMLQKSVYVSNPGGPKRSVYIEGIGATDNVQLILDTLRTTPEKIQDLDELEFVFVVTKDCALNPHVQEAEGYKIIPFNACDPEKMALYEQKRDELMAKIKADIDTKLATQSEAERTAHERKLEAIATWFAAHNCLSCDQSQVAE